MILALVTLASFDFLDTIDLDFPHVSLGYPKDLDFPHVSVCFAGSSHSTDSFNVGLLHGYVSGLLFFSPTHTPHGYMHSSRF